MLSVRVARNRKIAWVSFLLGALTGMVMGLWSFDGPFPAPPGFEDYDSLARRFVRLGHISFFGLGFLNILTTRHIVSSPLTDRLRRIGLDAMAFGNAFLPLTLFVAGILPITKYATSLPATAVFIALAIAALGAMKEPNQPTQTGKT